MGRVAGHRGTAGELTVRVSGQAALWTAAQRLWIARAGEPERCYRVERARAYRDRLVLKLHGIDDAGGAERLRGAVVHVALEDAPALPEGVHYTARVVGLEVVDESGRRLGTVEAVEPTGGADLLRVGPALLIPMARSIVLDIDEARGRITVRLPPGLEELNR